MKATELLHNLGQSVRSTNALIRRYRTLGEAER